MASNSNSESKRGPGRPAGSRSRSSNAASANSRRNQEPATREERIERMQAEYDRDRRNVDIIWSITLFAVGLFLLFTVVLNTTGDFGARVHDIALGLFGIMAYVLPFMIFIFAALLAAGKVRHISAVRIIFGLLIFINMCVLNSYIYIDEKNLVYSFKDIAQFYIDGIKKDGGGAIGMEIGTLLVKFFGKPGLLIIAIAVLLISVFLVANTPISRGIDSLARKRERRRLLNEMEAAERDKVQMAVSKAATPGADPETGIVPLSDRVPSREEIYEEPPGSRSIWKSILGGITKDAEELPVPSREEHYRAVRTANDSRDNAEVNSSEPVQVIKGPAPERRSSSSKTGLDEKSLPAQKDNSVMELVNRDTLFGRITKKLRGRSREPERMSYEGVDDEDWGYPGRRTASEGGRDDDKQSSLPGPKHYGLGDPDDVGHSGSYGLDGHKKGGTRAVSEKKPAGSSGVMRTSRDASSAGQASEKAAAVSHSSAPAHPSASSQTEKKNKKPAEKVIESSAEDEAFAESFNAASEDASYQLPPVSLLKKPQKSGQIMSDYQLEQKADLLEKTLNDFGVDARVLTVTQGASVTRYEVQPATGVKVSSITRLADDIALNLRAKSIRIEAPIPGKAAVGIEVENDKPSPVLVRELIESDEFMNAGSRIEFVVGKDISGNNIVADLKDMPHLLIAGATGSGKSVCINTIITSFLYKAKPSELRLIMIDPKVVELANYNGIPHMLTPVVTDPKKASRALAIAVEEMDKRYELFAKEGVKDLESYNELMRANHEPQNCKPQVVIIIDELADLMMASPSEVENSICRLAQKARAAGMHLIVATQRPSVDVVTGLIKANIPSRIAFSVASQFDSRTILDMAGAEKLLGKGDMLFSPVGSNKPYRVQGPFISDSETDSIIRFVKKEGGGPSYDEDIQNAIDNADMKGSAEPQDELTEDAIAFILKSGQASVSMLQRRFRIGYNRAARIIDEIEDKGIIGPSDGSRPRQVLITEEQYYSGSSNAAEAASMIDEISPEEKAELNEALTGKPHTGLLSRKSSDKGVRQAHSQDADDAAEADDLDGAEDQEDADDPEEEYETVLPAGTTSAEEYFNSLPESVRRQILNTDR